MEFLELEYSIFSLFTPPIYTSNGIFFRSISKNMKKNQFVLIMTQPAITCSRLTIETLEQGEEYVQS